MPSRRTVRVNDLLREELSDLLRQLKDPRMAQVVSITEVEVSPDLRAAKVHVSTLGTEAEKQGTLDALRASAGFLRRELRARLSMKAIPMLTFLRDESIEEGTRISALIDSVAHPKE